MSKARIMSAGTVGTSKRIRVNGPEGGGDALQGLPPICNMRSALVPYVRTRADGENRNVVFCVNQLSGGVGAKRGQFGPGNRAGVGRTGGCGDSKPWWFDHPHVLAALQTLAQYQLTFPKGSFNLIGSTEDLKSDHITTHPDYDEDDDIWAFEPLVPTEDMNTSLVSAINLINSLALQFEVNGKMEKHIVGFVGDAATQALKSKNYGKAVRFGSNGPVWVAFGDAAHCAADGNNPCSNKTDAYQFDCGGKCTNNIFGGCNGYCTSPDSNGICTSYCIAKQNLGNLCFFDGPCYNE